jgi:hypothetical protein
VMVFIGLHSPITLILIKETDSCFCRLDKETDSCFCRLDDINEVAQFFFLFMFNLPFVRESILQSRIKSLARTMSTSYT